MRRSLSMRLDQQTVKRNYPLHSSMDDQMCRIYSAEHKAWWLPNGHGYTIVEQYAWVLPFIDAWKQVSHCGPEKQIFIEVLK